MYVNSAPIWDDFYPSTRKPRVDGARGMGPSEVDAKMG
jgi:hypothetical protein